MRAIVYGGSQDERDVPPSNSDTRRRQSNEKAFQRNIGNKGFSHLPFFALAGTVGKCALRPARRYKNFKIGYYKYPERVQFVEQTIIAILKAIPLACLIYICMNIGR